MSEMSDRLTALGRRCEAASLSGNLVEGSEPFVHSLGQILQDAGDEEALIKGAGCKLLLRELSDMLKEPT